jgi:hypothetical protein
VGWGFPHPSRPAMWPIQCSMQWATGSSWGGGGADGVNWPERDFDHPPPSSVEVKSGPTPTVILSDFLNAPFCYDIERLFSLR